MKVMLAGTLPGKGGVQSHLRWMSRALSEAGFEVMILSLGLTQPSDDDLQIIDELASRRIEVAFSMPYGYEKAVERHDGYSRLKTCAQVINCFDPDIYLAVGTGWNLFLPAFMSRRKMHRIFFEVMSGVPVGWRDSRWSVKWGFDAIVGQANPVTQNFIHHFGWRKSATTIPAMPEPLEITAQLPNVKPKSVPIGKARAAFFSRLAPHKQAFWLVQQWHQLEDVIAELHIYGSGPEESLIRNYIAKENLADRVQCFGCYPEGQAYVDLLSSYDLTLLPTVGAEGAPLVLLESMACGVPFVANGVGGISDYGTDNHDVYIVPEHSGNFISAVIEMIRKLEYGLVDQQRLQRTYFKRYAYNALKQQWSHYLCQLQR